MDQTALQLVLHPQDAHHLMELFHLINALYVDLKRLT